jgi:hypothetical protein
MNCSSIVANNLQMEEEKVVEIVTKNILKQTPFTIPSEFIKNVEIKYLIKVLSDLIVSGDVTFPYKKYFLGDPRALFENLKRYTPMISTEIYNFKDVKATFSETKQFLTNKFFLETKQPAIIYSPDEEYHTMNVISDIFQEEARMKSVAGFEHPAPIEMWKDKKYHSFVEKLVTENIERGITVEDFRESFYKVSFLSETSTFKPSIARSVYMLLRASRILDFSSGWGDRLIGALSLEDYIMYYDGVDPNSDLQKGYAEMIQLAKPQNRKKYTMVKSPFETAKLPHSTYNCVFTSPPYFDYERYGDGAADNSSVYTKPVFEDWLIDFLFFSIKKSWSVLENNGYLALNISDSNQLVRKGNQFTEITILLINAYIPNAKYQGVLSFAGGRGAPRPIWIFQKRNNFINRNSELAKEKIKMLYPKVWRFLNPEVQVSNVSTNQKNFFIYDGTGLDKSHLREKLLSDGYNEIKTLRNVDSVDFMWAEQINDRFDKQSYIIKSKIKNILNDAKIPLTRKDLLYEKMFVMYPHIADKHMASSLDIKLYPQYIDEMIEGNTYIIKPVGPGACSGKDISIITYSQPSDVTSVVAQLEKYPNVVVCDYISNVHLFRGKKYHLRIYLYLDMFRQYSIFPQGKILTAKLPYKNSDFFNKDIHDTHMESSDDDYFFPRDLDVDEETTRKIWDQIRRVCKVCVDIPDGTLGPPEESEFAFEIFGLDFLVQDDFNVILLEVNDKVGYKSKHYPKITPDFKEFSKEYFDWVFESFERLN